MEINGIAHIFLTVSDIEKARTFYKSVLPFLGMTVVLDTPERYYAVGGRTGLGISAQQKPDGDRFNQDRIGLHHLCFRARSREDVDAVHAHVKALGAPIIRAPREDAWAPGYYSVLFEDPDGIRLEVNFVPGQGLLQPGRKAQVTV